MSSTEFWSYRRPTKKAGRFRFRERPVLLVWLVVFTAGGGDPPIAPGDYVFGFVQGAAATRADVNGNRKVRLLAVPKERRFTHAKQLGGLEAGHRPCRTGCRHFSLCHHFTPRRHFKVRNSLGQYTK